eukprot:CAMPEP_0185757450 /NCGR_PEP_ID=MMETSP1174-20130828/15918_1 /TAXON_ID=35687 /ORGANISM="Dictyocha speculum, Strain CCMP1381" /LENGTH=71 /DNA_ID=CAMNT_0028436861 /DNA_START=43 /DNA_END=255 /DNA_ORIENTATION=+
MTTLPDSMAILLGRVSMGLGSVCTSFAARGTSVSSCVSSCEKLSLVSIGTGPRQLRVERSTGVVNGASSAF